MKIQTIGIIAAVAGSLFSDFALAGDAKLQRVLKVDPEFEYADELSFADPKLIAFNIVGTQKATQLAPAPGLLSELVVISLRPNSAGAACALIAKGAARLGKRLYVSGRMACSTVQAGDANVPVVCSPDRKDSCFPGAKKVCAFSTITECGAY